MSDFPVSEDLEQAFALFTEIDGGSDVDYRAMYHAILDRMRMDAADVNTHTMVTLMAERIAHLYVVMRAKERGDLEPFRSDQEERNFNSFWLSLVQDFNKTVSSLQAKVEKDRDKKIKNAINSALSSIEDPVVRRVVKERIVDSLAEAGL